MRRGGGDEDPRGVAASGEEPPPAELWITGEPGGSGANAPMGSGPGHDPGGGTGGGPPPGGGPVRRGSPGGSGRARWIALAAGFAVLVAVVAVQHYAGGTHASSPGAAASSIEAPAATSAPPPSAATPASPSAGQCPNGICTDGDTPTAPDESGTPAGSMIARLSESGSQVVGRAPTSSTDGDTAAAPRTTRVPAGPLPDAESWTLLGYGPDGLVRYRPAAGQIVVTPVPGIQSGNLLSFLATPSAAIIRSMDDVAGYLVPDGKPAVPLGGLLAGATRALPGPDPEHIWLTRSTEAEDPQETRTTLVLVDAHGKPVGQSMQVPQVLGEGGGYSVAPDGAGYALVAGVGGTYDLTPEGAHLVTHGDVLAVGPTGYLVLDCTDTARCSMGVVDRATGKRRAVPGLAPSRGFLGMQGTISPDGRHAAMWTYRPSGSMAQLIDLTTGHVTVTGAGGGDDPSSSLTFTPDGRYLLVAGTAGVTAVSTGSGAVLGTLPMPPVRMIALRPTG